MVEKHGHQSKSSSARCCEFTSHWNPSTMKVEKIEARKKKKKVKIFSKKSMFKTYNLKVRKSLWEHEELPNSIVYYIASPAVCLCRRGGLSCSFTALLVVGNLLCIIKPFLINETILFDWLPQPSNDVAAWAGWHHAVIILLMGTWMQAAAGLQKAAKRSCSGLFWPVVKGPKSSIARHGSVLLR